MINNEFTDLILLIGTNPLPNFVVSDYFLQNNPNIQTIWLLHSEANKLQAGTDRQAKNLETLLRKYWDRIHPSLRFPLEKISISDVSNATTIRNEIEKRMPLKKWEKENFQNFHLDYTGGTKAMSNHVYMRLQELQKSSQYPFSYLDANNFRLVGDNSGIVADDLRRNVQIEFAELIALHGFVRKNQDSNVNLDEAEIMFKRYFEPGKKDDIKDGRWLEAYLASKIHEKLGNKLNNKNGIMQNWEIKKPDWVTYFELDIILLHGYHLTGISCYKGSKKEEAKKKGFEIIQRCKQIGGDEAKAILVAGLERQNAGLLQEDLSYETGSNLKNILVLGLENMRHENLYLNNIEEFVFG